MDEFQVMYRITLSGRLHMTQTIDHSWLQKRLASGLATLEILVKT